MPTKKTTTKHPMSVESLGCKAKDVISGFTGVITGQANYLAGAPLVQITSASTTKDQDPQWYDPTRVQVLNAVPVKLPWPDY